MIVFDNNASITLEDWLCNNFTKVTPSGKKKSVDVGNKNNFYYF